MTQPTTESTTAPAPAPLPPADDAPPRPFWRRTATAALAAATSGAADGVPF